MQNREGLSHHPTCQHQAENGYQHGEEGQVLNLRFHQATALEHVDVIPPTEYLSTTAKQSSGRFRQGSASPGFGTCKSLMIYDLRRFLKSSESKGNTQFVEFLLCILSFFYVSVFWI